MIVIRQFTAQRIAQRFQMRTSGPGIAQSRVCQVQRPRQRIALGLNLRGSSGGRKPPALEQIGLRIFSRHATCPTGSSIGGTSIRSRSFGHSMSRSWPFRSSTSDVQLSTQSPSLQ